MTGAVMLDNPVKKTHLLFNFPETLDEAQAIHEDTPISDLEAYMESFAELSREVTELGGIKIRAQAAKPANEWVRDYISHTGKDELVLILSHVEREEVALKGPDGDLIPYPDGALPLTDKSVYKLSESANSSSLVWTIGCDTWDTLSEGLPGLSFSRPIEYHESVQLARLILQSNATARSAIRGLQGLEFGRLPRNAPKLGGSKHFNPKRQRGCATSCRLKRS
jgi:hypothetical protein